MTQDSRRKIYFAGVWPLLFLALFLVCPELSRAATESAAASFTPWSGYWWPTAGGGLSTGNDYRGHPAPLEKYELLKNGTYPGPATAWDLDHHYDPDAPSWYGLCDAWAAASAYEQIRFYPSVMDNIVFRVGDKKGLLTACHDNDVSIRVNAETPDVFHYWLLHYLKEQGMSFYAELDPTVQVWNYPIIRYEMTTTEENGMTHVTCQIWYADDMVDPDIQGTVEHTKIYTYDLIKTGDEITGGAWTGASIYDHPQKLVMPVSPGSKNPYLDYQTVRTIAVSKDDELESDQPAELSPGGYNLILLDEDVYRVSCDEGDTVILHMEALDGLGERVTVLLRDKNGNTVASYTLQGPEDVILTAENPPYTLSFSAESYANGIVYHLDYDLKKSFEFANMKIQKGFGWGGFAVTNTGEAECDRISVIGYGKDGLPTETYVGPFSLAPGEKRIVMTSDFQVRAIDRDDFTGVKIIAPRDLAVVNLFGYFPRNMSCYAESKGNTRFVLPDFSTWVDSRSVSWGMYNPGLGEKTANLRLYSREGSLLDSTGIALGMNKAVHYSPLVSPFSYGEGGGWILVEDDGSAPLEGYAEWLEDGISKAEALGALGVGRQFFVPQVVHRSFWDQSFTLINVSGRSNSISLRLLDGQVVGESELRLDPHEKRVVKIKDVFPSLDDDVLNRCALEIRASEEMAGLTKLLTDEDDVYYPLMERGDVSRDLSIPHVASNGYWWTGAALYNPSDGAVHYRVEPYDAAGRLMEQAIKERATGAREKSVFAMKEWFGEDAARISFVHIVVTEGEGLAGLFAYGNQDCSMLSGAKMTPQQ